MNTTHSVTQVLGILPAFIGVKISKQTISDWIARGYFPGAIKQSPGRNSKWRIPHAALLAFVRTAYPNGPIEGWEAIVAPEMAHEVQRLVDESAEKPPTPAPAGVTVAGLHSE